MSDQWPAAFALADEIRTKGLALVAAVRSGEVDLAEAHARADAEQLTGRMLAVKVYEAVPGIGKVKARRAMEDIGIAESDFIADVPPDQRTALVAAFAELLADA